jgi:hypothetical protein
MSGRHPARGRAGDRRAGPVLTRRRTVSRKHPLPLAALAGLVLAALASAARSEEGKAVELFNGKDLTGWKTFIDPRDKGKTKPEDIWSVKDGVIICKGKPYGYIITEKEYGHYVLELEWRWAGKGGNSGVLCHVTGPDKIWPKSWEAQLFSGSAGDIWLVDGFKMVINKSRQDPNPRRPQHYFRMKTDKPVEKPVGEWNKYRITCKDGTVKLEINGQLVNEGRHAETTKGKILLQSEGAEVHFRNVKLTPIATGK